MIGPTSNFQKPYDVEIEPAFKNAYLKNDIPFKNGLTNPAYYIEEFVPLHTSYDTWTCIDHTGKRISVLTHSKKEAKRVLREEILKTFPVFPKINENTSQEFILKEHKKYIRKLDDYIDQLITSTIDCDWVAKVGDTELKLSGPPKLTSTVSRKRFFLSLRQIKNKLSWYYFYINNYVFFNSIHNKKEYTDFLFRKWRKKRNERNQATQRNKKTR